MNAAAETECRTPFELRVGERLGRLEILGHLADGGMARLWLALERTGNGGSRGWYVVKTVLPTLDRVSLGEYEEMLLAEAEVARRVRHPNVVRTFGVGRHEGHPYIVQELVPGPSLDRVLRMLASNGLRLPVGWVVQLGIGIARGLHGIHTATGNDGRCLGLIHRDINPSNVLLPSDGAPRIIDFGIAKPLRHRPASSVTFKGTMRFAPPEQIRVQQVDLRADLHALGILLHDALTGGRVFDDAPLIELAERRGSAPLLRDRLPEIPRELDRLLQELTSADPARRPTNALEVAHQLERIAREVSLPGVALLGELARIARHDRPAPALCRLGLSSTTDRRSGVRVVRADDTRETRLPRRTKDTLDQPTCPDDGHHVSTVAAFIAPEPTVVASGVRRSFAPPREITRPVPHEAQEPDTEMDAWWAAPTASARLWDVEALRAAAADPLSHVPTAVGPAPVAWGHDREALVTRASHERAVHHSADPVEAQRPSDDGISVGAVIEALPNAKAFDGTVVSRAERFEDGSEKQGLGEDESASLEPESGMASGPGQLARATALDAAPATECSSNGSAETPSDRVHGMIEAESIVETRALAVVAHPTKNSDRRWRTRRRVVSLPAVGARWMSSRRSLSRAARLGVMAWLVAVVMGGGWYFDVVDASRWLVTGIVSIAWALELRRDAR